MNDPYGIRQVGRDWLRGYRARESCELHWRKIRIELIVRRTFIDAGLLPDPLGHIPLGWAEAKKQTRGYLSSPAFG